MSQQNFLWYEFIGMDVEVIEATDSNYLNINGKIINETKNTLKILTNGKEKVVPKKAAKFRFKYNNKAIDVNGSSITFRPEDRIKKIKIKRR